MLGILQQWKEKQAHRKLLLEFYEELKKNLESYYVMDQLGRFRPFHLGIWGKFKDAETKISADQAISSCMRRLQEYNSLLEEFTKYEQWYASDINNKTPASAKILHDKREAPRDKFQGLEEMIKSAIINFETFLFDEKILKR